MENFLFHSYYVKFIWIQNIETAERKIYKYMLTLPFKSCFFI